MTDYYDTLPADVREDLDDSTVDAIAEHAGELDLERAAVWAGLED